MESDKEEKPKKYHIKFSLKGLPPGGNFRGNWRAKFAVVKEWKTKVHNAVKLKLPKKPLKKVKLRYTRHSCNMMDWDNLVISFKEIQDGLVESKVMKNDTVKNIPEIPEYRQKKAARGSGSVTVEVWEI